MAETKPAEEMTLAQAFQKIKVTASQASAIITGLATNLHDQDPELHASILRAAHSLTGSETSEEKEADKEEKQAEHAQRSGRS